MQRRMVGPFFRPFTHISAQHRISRNRIRLAIILHDRLFWLHFLGPPRHHVLDIGLLFLFFHTARKAKLGILALLFLGPQLWTVFLVTVATFHASSVWSCLARLYDCLLYCAHTSGMVLEVPLQLLMFLPRELAFDTLSRS